MDAVAKDRTAVAPSALAPERPPFQVALAVPDQDLVDGAERQLEAVLEDELNSQALRL